MTWYVAIKALNGRHDFARLAMQLEPLGFEDRVEYCRGGWEDQEIKTILPHLKFEDKDDAVAYVLKFGGKAVQHLPVSYSDP
jgi:hypothetical protein